ncbi:four-carbon acid sugar kinase family protein [Siculibacillus lacustris]|uniref:Four-carbon acid sugar kinase family protein n=1 Tax=Siculibacillus lacustris TaxID=1549641 RepID=A0A4Q9VWV5_9HYPH|nr:four-carbon acid sugar kinase family protein [Siculibacillus lacustris]TBW40848.1 four-carbon acid sugar kinase family protein [Siculibacillus lacustris]
MVDTAGDVTRPLLTFYGDDFTGSTDALEAVAMAGAPAMLFLEPPSPADLARFPGLAAIGVAGTSRSESPAWMDAHLPAIFEKLKALGAPLLHYKTCSTFDSAPDVGNIGRAAEIGRRIFGGSVPCVVGVVRHKRYVVFSNLFAAGSISAAREIFRIDRHPTMSRHPVTPMGEADLRRHLAAQTEASIAGFDFPSMLGPDASAEFEALAATHDIVVLDTFDAATTRAAGRLLGEHGDRRPAFVIGSSGVEYALVDHLTASGRLPIAPPPTARGPVDKLIAGCGSCSPITEAQIAWAENAGFAVIALDTVGLVEDDGPAPRAAVVAAIARALGDHPGVVLHTARGGADPRLAPTREALDRRGLGALDSSAVLGSALGRILRDAVAATGIGRVVLAGGDSSSHAVSAMGVEALAVAGPLVPGAPLCRIHAAEGAIDGVEISLKGGQVGGPDYFARVMAGR